MTAAERSPLLTPKFHDGEPANARAARKPAAGGVRIASATPSEADFHDASADACGHGTTAAAEGENLHSASGSTAWTGATGVTKPPLLDSPSKPPLPTG